MDFFAEQDRARRRTRLLVGLFLSALVLLFVGLYMVGWFVLGWLGESPDPPRLWNPSLAGIVASFVLAVVGGGSLVKILELRSGGDAVARMLGGRRVSPQPQDPDEQRYRNVVEEMAIASGIPTPSLWVLDGERGINAFAAGYTMDAAAVCVTEGALRKLTREELQGVVAHEFSHIFNGDMRLNIRITGVIHGLLVMALIGEALLRATRYARGRGGGRRGRGSGGAGLVLLIGLALWALGSIGVLFARLIQAAVSRQREYLADAAAVQFTRNPAGLAGALKKIAFGVAGSRLESVHAGEVSHFLFAAGRPAGFFARLWETHPPILERIRRLEPSFDPATARPQVRRDLAELRDRVRVAAPAAAEAAAVTAAVSSRSAGPSAPVAAEALRVAIGTPWADHLELARDFLAALPADVRQRAREAFGAELLVYALLWERRREATRAEQRSRLGARCGDAIVEQVESLARHLATVPDGFRLGVFDLAVPAMREWSLSRMGTVIHNAELLVTADKEVTLFEYALLRLLRRLREGMLKRSAAASAFGTVQRSRVELAALLSAVAHAGHAIPAEARAAFEAAVRSLGLDAPLAMWPPERCDLAQVDRALRVLERLPPGERRKVVEAVLVCLSHDGRVSPAEADLFRAIAAALDCPVPPPVAAGAAS